MLTPIALLFAIAACEPTTVDLDKQESEGSEGIEDAEGLADACAESTPETTTLTVTFDGYDAACPWDEGDNLAPEEAHVTARVEQVESLNLGADTVLCDVNFDFQAGDVEAQSMEYDDNFFFTFNDVILAASYAPIMDSFAMDGTLPIYDWASIAGAEFDFPADQETFCLGEAEGLATCKIPQPETRQPMALDFDPTLVAELSFRALNLGRLEYGFITFGDNDEATDCSHATFTFAVEVSYITQ